ncbi:hypothetical protein SI65_05003 [Aspergillus cristatus]|uniref:HTH CENPB-type domain-containing protein n=1 Tax=Aspergillus cristatus TaxID=573508 RepID=A0A1E3BGH6_ASPCR|nr:hypothetical protein SI65_05003 [Aspergillus cristatus]
MPPKSRAKIKDQVEQEGRVLLAISSLRKKEITNIREAARLYDVPQTTLQRRLNGSTNRAEKQVNGLKLTKEEEESLVQWILSMDQRGAAPRPSHVQDMANILLSNRGSSNVQPIGQNWVYKFIKHHNQLKTKFSRRCNYQRAKCEDPKLIKEWFDRVQIIIMQYGIAYEDIYNFDETGFAMGLIATARVVTRAETVGRPALLQPGNREWVTAIECVNAMGWALPPCIVFKGKSHIQAWYEDDALPHDWRIELSENGWTTDQIGLSWLQNIFIPATNCCMTGKYRLLILDGHGSHLTPKFDQICNQNNVVPICMPAHSSHLLQPLDVGCFAVLKRTYGRLVEEKMRQRINHIDKLDFLSAYPQARKEAFKMDNIKNGFMAAGLVPYNPERVLTQLNIYLKTPTPPGSQSTNSDPKTPHNLKQLEKQASTIKKLLKRRSDSPPTPTKSAMDQLVKGCQMAMNSATILAKENHDLRAANERQQQKRKRSNRQIAYTGGLSVQEAHGIIQSENNAQEASTTIPGGPASATNQPPVRAPPRCSDCRIIGHRRLQCPNRNRA